MEGIVPSKEWQFLGEYPITPEMNRDYCVSVDDNNAWYLQDSPFGGPIASPAFMVNVALAAVNQKLPRLGRRSVVARSAYEFFNPANVGKKIKVEGRIAEKYTKREKDYLVREVRLITEDGMPLLIYRQTNAFLGKGE